jgi:TatA/E family protein of Tat protein translocase
MVYSIVVTSGHSPQPEAISGQFRSALMNLFGMGPMEMMVILVVALIIFGPGKLPEIGAQLGRTVRDFRRMTEELTGEFEDSMNDVTSFRDEMKDTMTGMKRETESLVQTIPNALSLNGNSSSPVTSSAPVAVLAPDGSANAARPRARENESLDPPVATKADPLADFGGFGTAESSEAGES